MMSTEKNCFKCTKTVLYILNLLFWMLGAALLGLGIWLHLTNDALLSVSPGYRVLTPAALFIAPGCISILVGFLGCCGVITENRCMVTSYCVLVVVIITLELIAGVVAFVGDQQVVQQIESELRITLTERYPAKQKTTHDEDIVRGWDVIQHEFNCCGVESYMDWYGSHGWPSEQRVPDSCCIDEYIGCGNARNPALWYQKGCLNPISGFLKKHLFAIAVATIVFASVQLVTVIGAIAFLFYRRRHKQMR